MGWNFWDTALAVAAARRWYRLPYVNAAMEMTRLDGWIRYTSRRTHHDADRAEFVARYRAHGDPFVPASASIDAWLTERYRLYVADGRGAVGYADIDHAPWLLRRGEAEIGVNTMAQAHGLRIPNAPALLHVAERQVVKIGLPRRLALR